MWYKTPVFKMFIRDSAAILIGLAILRIARPILALSPDVQQLFDLFYMDIRSDTFVVYRDYLNMGLAWISFCALPFLLAGFLAGFLGERKGGVLLGILPAFFYTFIFVFLIPIIHINNKAYGYADNWLEWAVLNPFVYMLSGVIGGVVGWRLRFKIQSVRTHLKTTL